MIDKNFKKKDKINEQENNLLSLLNAILCSFKSKFEAGMSEFDLITLLKRPPYLIFGEDALREPLALFRTHFILFHSLYVLRNEWRQHKIGELIIDTRCIQLTSLIVASANKADITELDALAQYYLNWDNFAATTENEIDDLLDSFWQSIVENVTATDKHELVEEAATLFNLDLSTNITLKHLKQRYHKLQHQCHPDKGGSDKLSQSISDAYSVLCRFVSRQNSQ